MRIKLIQIFLIFLIILSIFPSLVLADLVDMSLHPELTCFDQQDNNVSFIDQGIYEKYNLNKTFYTNSFCQKHYNKNLDNCPLKDREIIVVQNFGNVCDYAKDKELCESCAENIRSTRKENDRNYFIIQIAIYFLLFVFLPLLVLYLIIIGIAYFIKRRILGSKWLFKIAITIFIIFALIVLAILFVSLKYKKYY